MSISRGRLAAITLVSVLVIAAALLGQSNQFVGAQGQRISGGVPYAGGISLVVWNGGTTGDLESEMRATGCFRPSAWTTRADGSGFVVHIFGAPARVNSAWLEMFATEIPAGQVLIIRCSRDPYLWPFSSDSPWNTPIGSNAQFAGDNDPRTTAVTSRSGAVNAAFWSHPVYLASESDPLRDIIQQGDVVATIRVPDGATPALPDISKETSDSHMHIVNPDHRTMLEMFGVRPQDDGSIRASYPIEVDLLGTGIAPRRGMSIGTRAYGGSAIGGLIRRWELEQGEIRHALAMAVPHRLLKLGPVWPATTQDGNAADVYDGPIPMGTLYAIPSDVDIESLGLTPAGLAFARALQDFGAYVTDAGGNGATFYAEPSADELLEATRADLSRILGFIRPVVNSGPDAPGGGGTPRAAIAPPLAN